MPRGLAEVEGNGRGRGLRQRGLALELLLQGHCYPLSKLLVPELGPREQAFGSQKQQCGCVCQKKQKEPVGRPGEAAQDNFLTSWVR